MVLSIEALLWYFILIDSIGANITAWFFPNWYKKKFKKIQKHFPASKSWCTWYLVLVLWLGYALTKLNVI
jgi:hypothetical protein